MAWSAIPLYRRVNVLGRQHLVGPVTSTMHACRLLFQGLEHLLRQGTKSDQQEANKHSKKARNKGCSGGRMEIRTDAAARADAGKSAGARFQRATKF